MSLQARSVILRQVQPSQGRNEQGRPQSWVVLSKSVRVSDITSTSTTQVCRNEGCISISPSHRDGRSKSTLFALKTSRISLGHKLISGFSLKHPIFSIWQATERPQMQEISGKSGQQHHSDAFSPRSKSWCQDISLLSFDAKCRPSLSRLAQHQQKEKRRLFHKSGYLPLILLSAHTAQNFCSGHFPATASALVSVSGDWTSGDEPALTSCLQCRRSFAVSLSSMSAWTLDQANRYSEHSWKHLDSGTINHVLLRPQPNLISAGFSTDKVSLILR